MTVLIGPGDAPPRDTAVAAVGLGAAVAIGWLASGDLPLIYAALPLAVAAGVFLALRPQWLLWCALLGGLVVAGLTKLYLPQLQLIRWGLAPLAILLAVQAIYRGMGPGAPRLPVPRLLRWALAFIGAVLLAGMAGDFVPERLAIAIKGYFQVWGLLLALAFFPWPPSFIDRLPRVLVAIGLLQLPFAAHQLIVLVPLREGEGDGIVPIDIVSGTFGGTRNGGGANAVLNAYLIIVLAGLIAARQLRVLSRKGLWLLAVPVVLPVLVNEAKVSVLYLAAVYGVLYGSDIARRPGRFLVSALTAGVLLAGVAGAYVLNAPSQSGVRTFGDLVHYTYEYNVADDEVGGELSRMGAIRFWMERHGASDPLGTLLGHGVGYTRVADGESDLRETSRATRGGITEELNLAKNIGNTAVAALLWETGLVGMLSVCGLLLATYRAAGRLEAIHGDFPERVAALRAVRAAMIIVFITFWHKNVFVFDVSYQTMLMLLIGYVAYWERRGGSSTKECGSCKKAFTDTTA